MIEIGDKLVAINSCIMTGSSKSTLTIGKKYTILKLDTEPYEGELDFMVHDDEGHEHWFGTDWKYLKHVPPKNVIGGKLL